MRSVRLWMVIVIFLMLPLSLFGAGGACPAGANYLSLSNPTGPLVALSSFGITSCYYIAANGSDSNSGTSESTPWLHAPGMYACSSNCLTLQNTLYPSAAGLGFIFRGGDTWHFGNSSASPYTGGGWVWALFSGTSSNWVYVGVDPGWHSGSSWARPILNADNPLNSSPVSSCAYQVAANPNYSWDYGNDVLDVHQTDYYIFDNFELTGMCWNTEAGGTGGVYARYSGANSGTGNPGYIENFYLHGWTHTTAGMQAGGSGFLGYAQDTGETERFNVIDGADSDVNSLVPWGENSDGYDVEYNVTNDIGGGGTVLQTCHILHDNLFQNILQDTDGSTHSDLWFCIGEVAGGSSSPNVFYNNIFRDIGEASNPWGGYVLSPSTPSGQLDYFFNNVYHDVYGSGSNILCDQGGCGNEVTFNSTAEANIPDYTGMIWGDSIGPAPSLTYVNDHWITNGGTNYTAVTGSANSVTETLSNEVYQTYSTATGQGYTSANDFSPTSASDATVTASGVNETTGYCADSVLHNATAEAACVQGITGVSYNSTNHTVVYPAFAPSARPATGAWNVGAYQFGGGDSVNPPTDLTATAH